MAVVGATGQAIDILQQVEELLAHASSSKSNLIKVQVFLRDFERGYGDFRDVWNSWVDQSALPVCPAVPFLTLFCFDWSGRCLWLLCLVRKMSLVSLVGLQGVSHCFGWSGRCLWLLRCVLKVSLIGLIGREHVSLVGLLWRRLGCFALNAARLLGF
jgi:enamine deaminase RidA (YjgF/YER057c/UK114 family)